MAADKPAVLDNAFTVSEDATMQIIDTEKTEENIVVRGDLNENGLLNIVDVQIAYDLAAGKLAAASLQRAAIKADFNGDGLLDAVDARAIQRAVHAIG